MRNRKSISNRKASRHPAAIQFAREQRSTANEFAETVWHLLRNRKCLEQKFRREYPIPPYTADFCCVALRLIIEIDGDDHFTEAGRRRDMQRDRYLRSLGYETLRIPGFTVLREPDAVRELIATAVRQRLMERSELPPHPQPLSPRQAPQD